MIFSDNAVHCCAENRYAVMFSFSNEDCSTRHAGISMSLANEVYMTVIWVSINNCVSVNCHQGDLNSILVLHATTQLGMS